MCGFAGCVSKKGINREKFEKMVDIIEHRGPDDRGTYYDAEVALGHRRLAIIDLSEDGHQPFFYRQDYVVVFNGEIFNYLELRQSLIKKGFEFQTQTDTEVLAAAYVCWGQKCVHHFNGMWSFLIYDKRKNIIFGSRDRFGVKPFYYTHQEGMFLAASEIKQFFEMIGRQPVANKEALLQYLIRGNLDYSQDTLFADVYELLGGYNIIIDIATSKHRLVKYYDLVDIKETDEDYVSACRSFRQRFAESVKLRLRADVPLGYSLSGGLDSSAIVCMADKIIKSSGSQTEQHTISSCFEDKRYDEREYIDEVIKQTNVTVHKIFPQETDLFTDLDRLIWCLDAPAPSASSFAAWNVYRAARDNGLTVLINGQGSDEQLAGYTHFYMAKFSELLVKGKFRTFAREWKIYKEKRAVTEKHISMSEIFKSSFVSMFIPDRKRYLIKAVYCLTGKSKLPFARRDILKALKNEPVYPMRDTRGFLTAYIKNELRMQLHEEDRESMAFSVEARIPFLDYRLVECIYAMPFDYKLRNGVTKAVLRDSLKGVLPDKVRTRYSKLGFATPGDQWINNNYEKYRDELYSAAMELSDLVDVDRVMKWFESQKGQIKRGDNTAWRIICAGRWKKIFNVSLE